MKKEFRKEWLNDISLKDWTMEVLCYAKECRCRHCFRYLEGKYEDLKKHTKDGNIVSYYYTFDQNLKFTESSATSKVKGSVAMYLSCHCAITICDHLTDILKSNHSNNKVIDDVKMHRS